VAVEVVDAEDKRAFSTDKELPGDFYAFRLDLTQAVLTTVTRRSNCWSSDSGVPATG
jgi:hypothetical protein